MATQHTGFSPGESSTSNPTQTSSGSFTTQKPPTKVQRAAAQWERGAMVAAPALPVTWTEDRAVNELCDEENSVRSRKSASGTSSSTELRLQRLQKEHKLASIELDIARAQEARSSRSGRSRGTRTAPDCPPRRAGKFCPGSQ